MSGETFTRYVTVDSVLIIRDYDIQVLAWFSQGSNSVRKFLYIGKNRVDDDDIEYQENWDSDREFYMLCLMPE